MTTYTVLTANNPKFTDYSEAQAFVIEQETAGKYVAVMQESNGSLWTVYQSMRDKNGKVIIDGGWAK